MNATTKYYPINEELVRRAKAMISFSDYKEGSATAEYRSMADEAAEIAERQKKRVDPMYHGKIDSLLDTYARKLARMRSNPWLSRREKQVFDLFLCGKLDQL